MFSIPSQFPLSYRGHLVLVPQTLHLVLILLFFFFPLSVIAGNEQVEAGEREQTRKRCLLGLWSQPLMESLLFCLSAIGRDCSRNFSSFRTLQLKYPGLSFHPYWSQRKALFFVVLCSQSVFWPLFLSRLSGSSLCFVHQCFSLLGSPQWGCC